MCLVVLWTCQWQHCVYRCLSLHQNPLRVLLCASCSGIRNTILGVWSNKFENVCVCRCTCWSCNAMPRSCFGQHSSVCATATRRPACPVASRCRANRLARDGRYGLPSWLRNCCLKVCLSSECRCQGYVFSMWQSVCEKALRCRKRWRYLAVVR